MGRRQQAKFDAEVRDRIARQDATIPGLEQSAASHGWMQVDAPKLITEDVMRCLCRVALGIHGVGDPDKTVRGRFRQMFLIPSNLGPMYDPNGGVRLVHCYQDQSDGRALVVGNSFFGIQFIQLPAGTVGTATPPPEELGGAFCAIELQAPWLWPWLQLTPSIKGWLSRNKNGLGYPDLDARFTAWCPNRDVARRIIGPELASLVASRDDWGISVAQGVLACVTLDPLASGDQAAELVRTTTRMAALLPTD